MSSSKNRVTKKPFDLLTSLPERVKFTESQFKVFNLSTVLLFLLPHELVAIHELNGLNHFFVAKTITTLSLKI